MQRSQPPLAVTGPRHRLARLAAGAILTAGLAISAAAVAGCGGEGSDVNCSLNSCTVTFDRGVDASASVLGIDVKLKSVQDGQVTLDIEGNSVQVPVGGETDAQAGGMNVRVTSVTEDQVVVEVSRDGG